MVPLLSVAACGSEADTDNQKSDYNKVNQNAKKRKAYIPKNGVEFKNYNDAQKLYDSPTTVIWCSTTWGNPSAPIVTIPIAGKLTSSSVSYFPSNVVRQYDTGGSYNPELKSVDGMFHGSPPPYRYGFTPGGQYVDFFNMPTVCTTALTKFQREKTQVSVSVDAEAKSADAQAQDALKRGDKAGAQRALEGLESK